MANQTKFSQYYGVLRVLLVLLIVGRVLNIIGTIVNFNKPTVDELVVEIMNQKGYKISTIIGSVFDIVLFTILCKSFTNQHENKMFSC